MFITAEDFKEHNYSDADAEMAAKVVNYIIDNKGRAMYGRVYDDGGTDNFSNVRDINDTHVCMSMGFKIMPLPKTMPDYATQRSTGATIRTGAGKELKDPTPDKLAMALDNLNNRLDHIEYSLNIPKKAHKYQTMR